MHRRWGQRIVILAEFVPMASLRPLLLVVAAAALGACTNPEREAQLMSELVAMGDALNETRSYIADLEGRLDSLRTVVARHDTATIRLAEFTGVQIPKAPY
jgi:hypothetical protein